MDRSDGDAWHGVSILIHNAALNGSEGHKLHGYVRHLIGIQLDRCGVLTLLGSESAARHFERGKHDIGDGKRKAAVLIGQNTLWWSRGHHLLVVSGLLRITEIDIGGRFGGAWLNDDKRSRNWHPCRGINHS